MISKHHPLSSTGNEFLIKNPVEMDLCSGHLPVRRGYWVSIPREGMF